jgi:hypothetical protein
VREHALGPPRALLSFWYFRKRDLDQITTRIPGITLMSDSGGFTADTQGAPIAPAEYAEWLTRWDGKFEAVANLDVVRTPEATWRNHQEVEQVLGKSVIPVVHFGTKDYERWLGHYVEQGHTYICLGGMVGQSQAALLRWTTHCHHIARDAGIVLHGFGVSGWSLISQLPWYSCDSSAWGQAHRYGQTTIWDPRTCRMVRSISGNATRKDFAKQHGRGVFDNDLGRSFDSRVLTHPDHWDRIEAAAITADSYRRMETFLRSRFGEITRPGTDATGLRLYLVEGAMDNLELIRGREALDERKRRAATSPEAG